MSLNYLPPVFHIARTNVHEPSGCRLIMRKNLVRKLAGLLSAESWCVASKKPHS